jgi:hypothetical protein
MPLLTLESALEYFTIRGKLKNIDWWKIIFPNCSTNSTNPIGKLARATRDYFTFKTLNATKKSRKSQSLS